jgi:hypothetical protein
LKNKIIFNNYKTAKKYGRQTYDINPNIMSILKKYLKINKTDYLFPKGDQDVTAIMITKNY